jgi:hypothetical protein
MFRQQGDLKSLNYGGIRRQMDRHSGYTDKDADTDSKVVT